MTIKWLKCAAIRAIKTFAQAAGALIVVGATLSEIDWATVFSSAAVAAIISLLTSVAGLPEVELENKVTKLEKMAEVEYAKDADACYAQMLKENNELREQLYPDADIAPDDCGIVDDMEEGANND